MSTATTTAEGGMTEPTVTDAELLLLARKMEDSGESGFSTVRAAVAEIRRLSAALGEAERALELAGQLCECRKLRAENIALREALQKAEPLIQAVRRSADGPRGWLHSSIVEVHCDVRSALTLISAETHTVQATETTMDGELAWLIEAVPREPQPPAPQPAAITPSARAMELQGKAQTLANAKALASCVRDGLLNPKSRHQYDEQTIAEMILAQIEAAALNAQPAAGVGGDEPLEADEFIARTCEYLTEGVAQLKAMNAEEFRVGAGEFLVCVLRGEAAQAVKELLDLRGERDGD